MVKDILNNQNTQLAKELYLQGQIDVEVLKALGNETRLQILEILKEKPLNVHEIQKKIGCSKTTILTHLTQLESAGLISTYYVDGTVGHQKFCKRNYNLITIDFDNANKQNDSPEYYEMEIAVGNYFGFNIYPPCGLATTENLIFRWDDPSVFFSPNRVQANLLWCSHGFFEYKIPLNLPFGDMGFTKMEISFEISAQRSIRTNRMLNLPSYISQDDITDGISDITFSISGRELGTITIQSDKRRDVVGKNNPSWWKGEPFGKLITLSITEDGTYANSKRIGNTVISDILSSETLNNDLKMKLLMITAESLDFKIEVKDDAKNKSGFCLFGKGFGNHSQNISFKFYNTKIK